MNKKTKLVLELLKTKASSLGFNKEELEGAANTIASNLGVDDDATDEALNAAADKAVAVYIPILELSQKNANRIIQKNKEEREKAEAEAKRRAEEEAAAARAEEAARKAAEEASFQRTNGYDDLAKQLKEQSESLKKREAEYKKQFEQLDAFRKELDLMKAERVKATRESRLDELVKDAGVYGKRIKENYGLMTFKTDEDFDKFLDGVQDDIKAFNQERADKGLDKIRVPGVGGSKEDEKQEAMTEAEIDALAAIM